MNLRGWPWTVGYTRKTRIGRSTNQFLHSGFQGFDIHRFYNESGNVIQVQIRILPQPRVGGADKDRYRVEEDRQAFVERIRPLVRETGARVLAWALMDNHVHRLLISDPAGLPTLMRRLLVGYSVNMNLRHKRRVHLFQNRTDNLSRVGENQALTNPKGT